MYGRRTEDLIEELVLGSEKPATIHASVPQDLSRRVAGAAKRRGMTANTFVMRALEFYLAREQVEYALSRAYGLTCAIEDTVFPDGSPRLTEHGIRQAFYVLCGIIETGCRDAGIKFPTVIPADTRGKELPEEWWIDEEEEELVIP